MIATDELRERIAKAIASGVIGGWTDYEWNRKSDNRGIRNLCLNAADDVLAVLPAPGPRMVSIEEAEKLPRGSVLRDANGNLLQRWVLGDWQATGVEWIVQLDDYIFPAQLLWTPEDVTE